MSDPFDAIEKIDGVQVPIDPMDMLQCESCQ
jgi:hypothetical protein